MTELIVKYGVVALSVVLAAAGIGLGLTALRALLHRERPLIIRLKSGRASRVRR